MSYGLFVDVCMTDNAYLVKSTLTAFVGSVQNIVYMFRHIEHVHEQV